MEFLDEDARPRFLFQSRAPSSLAAEPPPYHQRLNKPLAAVAVAISSVLIAFSLLYVETEPFKSIVLWLALSLLIGPFAPISVTGGDIRVGEGPIVEFPDLDAEVEEDTRKRSNQKRSKPRRSEDPGAVPAPVIANGHGSARDEKKREGSGNGYVAAGAEEVDWTEEDVELLRRQLVKNPAGKPRRWEIVAEAFRGRHKVDSVIKMSKDLGERKFDDGDSYAKFLKNRKMDQRIETPIEGLSEGAESKKEDMVSWTNGEDIALLNALKAFPKEASMRWEKIAAAVPGKTKAACMKRVTELKKGFRSSKAGNDS